MPPYVSLPQDLALHGPRVLDFEASGWVSRSSFADRSGWSVTDAGRLENERRLATELDRAGARDTVTSVHTDRTWDERVLRTLASLDRVLRQSCNELTNHLQRFDGYADRYSSALAKVDAGQRRWVDAPDFDSCHTVWIQFHEDLLATLGIPRGSDA